MKRAACLAGVLAGIVAVPLTAGAQPALAQPALAQPAAPTRDAAPEEETVSQQDAAHPTRAHFALRADGGAAVRTIQGIAAFGAITTLGFTFDRRVGDLGANVYTFFGETEDGIAMRQAGGSFEASFFLGDIVRVGVLPRVGWIAVDRFTEPDARQAMTLGIAGRLAFDVVRSDGFALALGIEPDAFFVVPLMGSGAGVFSIGSFLQMRYRFERSDDPPKTAAGPGSF